MECHPDAGKLTHLCQKDPVFSKVLRAADVGGEGVGHDLVFSCALQTSDALNGEAETQGEPRVRLNDHEARQLD